LKPRVIVFAWANLWHVRDMRVAYEYTLVPFNHVTPPLRNYV
jgi:hypothetical protein